MRFYPSKQSEPPFFITNKIGEEDFFKKPRKPYPANEKTRFRWHTNLHENGAMMAIVVQGLNEHLLNELLHFLEQKLHPAPASSPIEELVAEISSLCSLEASPALVGNDQPVDLPKATTNRPVVTVALAEREGAYQPLHKTRTWTLEEINHIIDKNLENENFRVNDLAKCLNYCTMQVHRIIKDLTQLPSAQYIKRYRLAKSQSMLLTGKYNISQVAYMVGFKSPEHFSRAFRAEFGKCPSAFRSLPSAQLA